MSHAYILWFVLFGYSVHVLEERVLLWLPWAKETFGLPLSWEIFYVANAAVLFTAIAAAAVNWQCVSFGLIIAALMLVNGIFFHIIPTIRYKRISPGVITAVILFLPLGSASYYCAYLDGVLTWTNGIFSVILGWLLMASPFIFFNARKKWVEKNHAQPM